MSRKELLPRSRDLEPVEPPAPSRASIERLLLDAYPALASAPPRLRAHLERHADAIAQLVDAAGEGDVGLGGGRVAG